MKYLIALVAGYYVLEAIRHFVRQVSKLDADDKQLPIGYKVMLCGIIILTCVFWPIMLFKGRAANV